MSLGRLPTQSAGSKRNLMPGLSAGLVPWLWRGTLTVLLFAPLLVSSPLPGTGQRLRFGWPRVHAGDEPHYLVMLNSILQDGDLDLANQYAAVHRGSSDAGRSFEGAALDHHVSWYLGNHLVYWTQVYENESAKWRRDQAGHPMPTLRENRSREDLPVAEYPMHPPGLALLLAPIALPFRGTRLVEPVALFCTATVVVLGMFWFELLIEPYVPSWRPRLMVTTVTFLGTPVWHYARTLFADPYLMTLAIAAYALTLRLQRHGTAGVLIAMGVWMKPPFVLLLIPIALHAVLRRNFHALGRAVAPVALAVVGILWLNQSQFGSCLHPSVAWHFGNPLEGLAGLLLWPLKGLVPTAPAALLLLVTLRPWFKDHRSDAILLGLGSGLYFGMMAMWWQWDGGTCYGPRLILPIVPLLFVGLCGLFSSDLLARPIARWLVGGICGISMLFGCVSAFACEWANNDHPLVIMYQVTRSLFQSGV